MAATWTPLAARSVRSVQALTEAAPTLESEGLNLDGVFSISPVLHAPGGQTFTGAGKLLGYAYRNGAWVRVPRADVPLDEIAGLADADLPSLPVTASRDKFALIASAVGVTGGAQVTLELYCTNRGGREVT